MDVLTSETCWALNNEIKKHVTSSWSLFIQLASVCPHRKNADPTGWIMMKFDIWVLFENLSIKLKFNCNQTRITGTLLKYLCTFMLSHWILLTMKNFGDKMRMWWNRLCVPPHSGHQKAASSVHYTNCKHSLALLRMGEIITQNIWDDWNC